MSFDTYGAVLPGFASSLELVGDGLGEPISTSFTLQEPARFVLATLTLPNGQQPAWDLGRLELKNNNSAFVEPQNDEQTYVDPRGNLVIVNGKYAADSYWSVYVAPTNPPLPVAVNIMAFHGNLNAAAPPAIVVPGPTLRCRGCKITAKALALAIVAAAALPALPAALIAAVAAYLGVGAVIAAAFIGSVIGDTADIIAEKLCKKIGLC